MVIIMVVVVEIWMVMAVALIAMTMSPVGAG
jgi:hypothetical protein